jgi:hypothetical protein
MAQKNQRREKNAQDVIQELHGKKKKKRREIKQNKTKQKKKEKGGRSE